MRWLKRSLGRRSRHTRRPREISTADRTCERPRRGSDWSPLHAHTHIRIGFYGLHVETLSRQAGWKQRAKESTETCRWREQVAVKSRRMCGVDQAPINKLSPTVPCRPNKKNSTVKTDQNQLNKKSTHQKSIHQNVNFTTYELNKSQFNK